MSLFIRRLLMLLVVTAIGVAGAPIHAGGLAAAHHRAPPVEQDEHRSGVAHDRDAADVDCMQLGHCFPVQLLVAGQIDAHRVLRQDVWATPTDVYAASLKPDASTPPPRSA